MAPIPLPEFADLLADLDREAFEGFLIDLWEARGRDPQIEEGVLVDGSGRYLLDHRTPWLWGGWLPSIGDEGIDGIVTSRRIDSAPDGVQVIDAGDLRGMALYAVDRRDREELFSRYFGRPPTGAEEDRGLSVSAPGAGAVVVLVAAVAFTAIVLGGFPGGTTPTTGGGTPTATPVEPTTIATTSPSVSPAPVGTPASVESPESTATPPDRTLLALSGDEDGIGRTAKSALFEAGDRPVVVEFTHPGEEGFFSLWVDTGGGTRRWLVNGTGSSRAIVLADLPRGQHRLFVQAVGQWRLRVRASGSPSIPEDPTAVTIDRSATTYAGPIAFSRPVRATVYGIDANATYDVALVDPGGEVEAVLADGTGSTGVTSSVVDYRGEGFVRVTSTGRWRVVLEPSDRGGPPHGLAGPPPPSS